MIVTTTNILDGYEITEYVSTISAHVVAGTNIFKDLFAEFSDVFGGRSKTYQNELSKMNETVIYELQKKAQNLNANAIIGLHIENNEISGIGKQMFMVTAYGTAVRTQKIIDLKTIETNKLISVYTANKNELYLRELESRGYSLNKINEIIKDIQLKAEEDMKVGLNPLSVEELKNIFESSSDEQIKKEYAQELVKRGYEYYKRFLK